MGQREPIEWGDSSWIWGDDADYARQQQQLRRTLHSQHGRPLLKAEQWAAFEGVDATTFALSNQYDLFKAQISKPLARS